MLYGEGTLNHADDHAVVQARIDVPMGGVHRDQHRLASFYGLMLCSHDHNPVSLQAHHDFIRHRMAMQTVLLPWLKTVQVAMEGLRLPDPCSNKTVLLECLHAVERFLFHWMRSLLLLAMPSFQLRV